MEQITSKNINSSPLLSIAIPTWNRSAILKLCLERLLPQINDYLSEIQFVICDNFSDDSTQETINDSLLRFSNINYISFRQSSNTGYFGNFKKCRELSKGKYFWLLSDNDFIEDGLISFLIHELKTNSPEFVFLKDWGIYNKRKSKVIDFSKSSLDSTSFFKRYGDRSTLISSIIFRNNKSFDFNIYSSLEKNTFLGFFLFLSSINTNSNCTIISGISLNIYPTRVSFNVFKSFGEDLLQGLNYLNVNCGLSPIIIDYIVNLCIINISSRHYIVYRIFGNVHNVRPGSKNELENFLSLKFSKFEAFNSHMKPLFQLNFLQIFLLFITRKVSRFLKKKFNFTS
ncbi:glycosyltransferase family 2 protein [Algoriphagus formosus]|uniref:Glycosyltransferase n=1 Tax=Algoriphagus formosus TaxID=2007308 RepID=A0A4R5USF0_9BACT|nr:glycosyltransferase family 2 protein [Algoriphagus aquimaris]TDK42039.1 glycosyltransferase [Algoriphagus aquimaris]